MAVRVPLFLGPCIPGCRFTYGIGMNRDNIPFPNQVLQQPDGSFRIYGCNTNRDYLRAVYREWRVSHDAARNVSFFESLSEETARETAEALNVKVLPFDASLKA